MTEIIRLIAHIIKGANLIYSARTGEGREAEMAALRLNPRDPLGLGRSGAV